MSDHHPACPGIKTILDGETPEFICVTVMVFYKDSAPDGDYVYLTGYPFFPFGSSKVAQINTEIEELFNTHMAGRAGKVRIMGIFPVQMDAGEQAEAGWHIIRGDVAAAPAAPAMEMPA